MSIEKNQRIGLYTVTLRTLTPMHIGAYQDPMSDVNNPFTTLGGQVVVQGSSLKGALRAQLEEYLILNYPGDPAMRPCIPAPLNNLSPDERQLVGDGKPYRGGNCGGERGRTRNLCPTCYLLGTMSLTGFIQVPYLYLSSEHEIEEVYQNRRDRARDTVAEGANRAMQGIPKDAEFTGTLEVLLHDEIRGWTLGQARRRLRTFRDEWLEGSRSWSQEDFLREFVTDRVAAIPRMGGHISKGFGNVAVAVAPVGEKRA